MSDNLRQLSMSEVIDIVDWGRVFIRTLRIQVRRGTSKELVKYPVLKVTPHINFRKERSVVVDYRINKFEKTFAFVNEGSIEYKDAILFVEVVNDETKVTENQYLRQSSYPQSVEFKNLTI